MDRFRSWFPGKSAPSAASVASASGQFPETAAPDQDDMQAASLSRVPTSQGTDDIDLVAFAREDWEDIAALSAREVAAEKAAQVPSPPTLFGMANARFDAMSGSARSDKLGALTELSGQKEAAAGLEEMRGWTPSGDTETMTSRWRNAFADDFARAVSKDGVKMDPLMGAGRSHEFTLTTSLYDLADAMGAVRTISQQSFPNFMNSESTVNHPIREAFDAAPKVARQTPAEASEADKARSSHWQAGFDRSLESTLLDELRKPGALQRIKAHPDALFNNALTLMSQDERYSSQRLD